MHAGPQNVDFFFFFPSSGTLLEGKGRKQCKIKSKDLKLMFSWSRNPYFPGGHQLAGSRGGVL